MTINFTRKPDTGSVQRTSYMAAFSLAETLLSETTAVPTSVNVEAAHFAPAAPLIKVYFHHDSAAVREFAAQFSLVVKVEEFPEGQQYTEANSERHGVKIQAWALLNAEQVAAATDAQAAA
ncbi:hypothetical protein OG596_26600 [Streptomyces sp. NBC_01102]|uniref:hypothetical protein n=1 Tax=Streptomyces sp. NBC_01102 TaxID=2903749 RepID=UPI00386D0C15|nr:hypothetical protein OG596_26600 [Streptomyces sp. NBC_01102]